MADVALGAEPQLTPVGQAGDDGLGDVPTGVPVPGGELGRLVQAGTGVGHLQKRGVRRPQRLPVRVRKHREDPAQLTAGRSVEALEEAPVR